MSSFSKRVVRDSADVDLALTGVVDAGVSYEEMVFSPSTFKDSPTTGKLTAVFHSIESGLRLFLYWEHDDDDTLIMPLEGRGILDLTRFGGLENPRLPGFTGAIILRAVNDSGGVRHFAISLEISKQR